MRASLICKKHVYSIHQSCWDTPIREEALQYSRFSALIRPRMADNDIFSVSRLDSLSADGADSRMQVKQLGSAAYPEQKIV